MSDDRAKIAVAFTPEESYAVKVAVSQLQEAKLKEKTFDDNLGKALGEVWQKVRAAERKGMPTIDWSMDWGDVEGQIADYFRGFCERHPDIPGVKEYQRGIGRAP